jgi:hypothetical protein
VRGKVVIQVASGVVLSNTGLFRVRVQFAKPYATIPYVSITPTQTPDRLNMFVSAVTNTFFDVTYVNNATISISGLPTNYSFNYFVIE